MEIQGVQYLVNPSTGLGSSSQQIISIPVNLLTQGNQSLGLITANGQIIQLSNFCKCFSSRKLKKKADFNFNFF